MLITLAPMLAACTIALASVAMVPALRRASLSPPPGSFELVGPRGLADGDDPRVRSHPGDAVRVRRAEAAGPRDRPVRRASDRPVRSTARSGRGRRWRWWRWRRLGLGDRHCRRGCRRSDRWRRSARRRRCRDRGRRSGRRRERRSGRHRGGHRNTLRRSSNQRRDDGAVRVAVHQPVAAHDVVAAGNHRQPRSGVDPGVDDRDGHTVAGRVLPGLGDVEHREAGRGHRDIRVGDRDGAARRCCSAASAAPARACHPAAPRPGSTVGGGIACAAGRLARQRDQQPTIARAEIRRRIDAERLIACAPSVNRPPIQAASGSAATIAAISSHSAIIRTSGVNRVTGTSSAATNPAAPKPASTSAPHSTASDDPPVRARRT